MNISDWRAFTSTLDNGYANWHMTAMLDICKLADFRAQTG